ncbi:glycosyltransferase family 2 protein [Paenibacillus hexagrammi]|uniref:Glycosyltransferase n=1 Tax=Paenibacillus hexagrammi TaxID=2908839 RepID=A0ABY3SRA4_9BACL|nr:glycosyltransferase family 2 protein [Paenibacillus sp. YPD9-1]UJF35502.1 glycosyltransferase [Paenibacillus sp. YPD9-1]
MDPLVSILLPTYNRPKYVEQALKSALQQTYANVEIIICDNSNNDETERIVSTYLEQPGTANLKYVKNKSNIGPIANMQKCFDLASGDFINYLMDDDLLHPEKIAIMVKAINKDNRITLVTSRRAVIDMSGQAIHLSSQAHPFYLPNQKKNVVDGNAVIQRMLYDRKNYIGEPTSVLFRKADLKQPFGVFYGKLANNNVDVATWLSLLEGKKAVFLSTPLNSFRKHANQISQSTLSKMALCCDWIDHILTARKHGLLTDHTAYLQAITKLSGKVCMRFPEWNMETNRAYHSDLVKRAQLLLDVCHKKKLLKEEAQLKRLLDQLDDQRRKKKRR